MEAERTGIGANPVPPCRGRETSACGDLKSLIQKKQFSDGCSRAKFPD
jgi:hypothetical protein